MISHPAVPGVIIVLTFVLVLILNSTFDKASGFVSSTTIPDTVMKFCHFQSPLCRWSHVGTGNHDLWILPVRTLNRNVVVHDGEYKVCPSFWFWMALISSSAVLISMVSFGLVCSGSVHRFRLPWSVISSKDAYDVSAPFTAFTVIAASVFTAAFSSNVPASFIIPSHFCHIFPLYYNQDSW